MGSGWHFNKKEERTELRPQEMEPESQGPDDQGRVGPPGTERRQWHLSP